MAPLPYDDKEKRQDDDEAVEGAAAAAVPTATAAETSSAPDRDAQHDSGLADSPTAVSGEV